MVITPENARSLSEEEIRKLSDLEKYIDQRLTKISGNFPVDIYITTNEKETYALFNNRRIREEIIRRYSEAGWKVEHIREESNALDNYGHLEFRPK